jgi:ppGpp synthetase/RelA/SpoT-type nucleotidyltranferase
MDSLNFSEIEYSLLNFRIGRRLVLDRVLEMINAQSKIQEPALLLSRLFIRIKSADSIVEKIMRKKLPVQSVEDIPRVLDDILGLRIIAENQEEFHLLDQFLTSTFTINTRINHAEDFQGFGDQSFDYAMTYVKDGQVYPFAVQLRTFLQHYWAGQSFFLFHKAKGPRALKYHHDLLALSRSLQDAESLAAKIRSEKPTGKEGTTSINWDAWPIRSRVYLMIVKPKEQFVEQRIVSLCGNDVENHHSIADAKIACYREYPAAAVVECMCVNFSAFLLNEPQVHVSPESLAKIIW